VKSFKQFKNGLNEKFKPYTTTNKKEIDNIISGTKDYGRTNRKGETVVGRLGKYKGENYFEYMSYVWKISKGNKSATTVGKVNKNGMLLIPSDIRKALEEKTGGSRKYQKESIDEGKIKDFLSNLHQKILKKTKMRPFDKSKRKRKKEYHRKEKKYNKMMGISDSVELDESRMSELHMLIKQGKSAEQIAKIMKVDVKTIKELMKESITEMQRVSSFKKGDKVEIADKSNKHNGQSGTITQLVKKTASVKLDKGGKTIIVKTISLWQNS